MSGKDKQLCADEVELDSYTKVDCYRTDSIIYVEDKSEQLTDKDKGEWAHSWSKQITEQELFQGEEFQ